MIVRLIWVMMQCHRIVSQACKDAKDMFKASHELAVLCAIGATLPADAEIDNLSLANIRKLGGVRFEAADTQFIPRKYRCNVVPAIFHALAEEYRQASKNDDGMRSAAAMFTTIVESARPSNSPARFESFLHAYFALAWGQRLRETLLSAFPCLRNADTPLRPITQYCTVDNATLGSALKFEHGKLAIIDPEHGGVIDLRAAPTSIHFSGTGNAAQPGFDIMMFQPPTNESAAVLVLIEAKYSADSSDTTRLGPSDVKPKVEQCVVELAPFLPGM